MVRVQTAPGTSITKHMGGGDTANDAEFVSGKPAMAAVWRVQQLPGGGQHLRLPAVQWRSLRQLLCLLPWLVHRV